MTIVLQHQFWNLTVTEQGFEVGLSFHGTPETLSIPFDAVTGFFDPSVEFGLKFEIAVRRAKNRRPARRPPSRRAPRPAAGRENQAARQRQRTGGDQPRSRRRPQKPPLGKAAPKPNAEERRPRGADKSRLHRRFPQEMSEIVNLRQARKAKARAAAADKAAENRLRFGASKAERAVEAGQSRNRAPPS